MPGLIPVTCWHGFRDNPVEHLMQWAEVPFFGRDSARVIVNIPADCLPVQLPSGIPGDSVPEHSLDAPVSLPEGMDVIELVVVVGEALDEILAVRAGRTAVAGSR
jgi:hypothetical protein